MLDWLIAHNPDSAQHTIGELVGEAERRLEIPRQVTEHSLRLALDLDSSKLDSERRREFLNRAFPPQTTPAADGSSKGAPSVPGEGLLRLGPSAAVPPVG